MKVTRTGLFETNSSSSHTIVLSPKDIVTPDQIPVGDDGVCRIFPGEFGWGPEVYTDAPSKASYCLTFAKNDVSGPESDRLLEMLSRVIAGQVKAPVTFVENTGEPNFYPWGYIDHQSGSEGRVAMVAFALEEALHRFIFNPDSVLAIDNDNDSYFHDVPWPNDPDGLRGDRPAQGPDNARLIAVLRERVLRRTGRELRQYYSPKATRY